MSYIIFINVALATLFVLSLATSTNYLVVILFFACLAYNVYLALNLKKADSEVEFHEEKDTSIFHEKEYINNKLDKSIGENRGFVLYRIDLNEYKIIRDTQGDVIGDAILEEAEKRLTKLKSDKIIFSKIENGEFLVIYFGKDTSSISEMANKFSQTLKKEFVHEEVTYKINPYIGATAYPSDAKNTNELTNCAKEALKYAVSKDINTFFLMNKGLKKEILAKRELTTSILKIKADKDLNLLYAPVFNIQSDTLSAIKVIRQIKVNNNLAMFENDFIPTAEKFGVSKSLCTWGFRMGLKQIGEWNKMYEKDLPIHVSVSKSCFYSQTLIEDLKRMLEGLEPSWLAIDMAEDILMYNFEMAKDYCYKMSEMNMKLNLVNVGKSHINIAAINQFHIDYIKISPELVEGLTRSELTYETVKGILSYAKELNIDTVAQGVNTKTQYDIIKELGVSFARGDYFGKPLSKEEFEKKYLQENFFGATQ